MEINKGNSNKETFLKKSLKILKKTYLVGWLLFIVIFSFSLFGYITANGAYDKYKNLTSSELVGHLMSEISTMDSRFSTTITWLFSIMTVLIAFIGFYSYQQLKMSKDQIKQIRKEFGIEEINGKIQMLNNAIENASSSLLKQQQDFEISLKQQKIDYYIVSLELVTSNVENITESTNSNTIYNDILGVSRVLNNIKNTSSEINKDKMLNSLIAFGNGLFLIEHNNNMNKDKKNYQNFLKKLNEISSLFGDIPKQSQNTNKNDEYNEELKNINDIISKFPNE
ncbi:hypothetical protein M3M39_06505 [Fructilactobacillus hinvesii]|uniref:Uncharacterized protein n=1 Tax=Fructilactobacillus hinvesii TaxID=2940300 RepID=A0ABY5BS14_9LACO|nr:hypothetical protein [Fructilactobacillus hinvesii]USS87750.1 hypothetical protein M3M39_06505 [Fructilactobacillus hinvesii]